MHRAWSDARRRNQPDIPHITTKQYSLKDAIARYTKATIDTSLSRLSRHNRLSAAVETSVSPACLPVRDSVDIPANDAMSLSALRVQWPTA